MTTRHFARRLPAVLLTVALCGAAAAGCGDEGGSGEAGLLELRPVLAANPPPCPEKGDKGLVLPHSPGSTDPAGPSTDPGGPSTDPGGPSTDPGGKVAECLELGKPIVDAEDVRSATVAETPGKQPALSVVLGGVGSANLDGYAKANQGKRLAIVADGAVVSAPVLQFASFAGRIQVSGLSKEKTDDLFRRLNEVIKPG